MSDVSTGRTGIASENYEINEKIKRNNRKGDTICVTNSNNTSKSVFRFVFKIVSQFECRLRIFCAIDLCNRMDG